MHKDWRISMFSFAYITDAQLGATCFGLDRPGSASIYLERAIHYVNESNVDFIVLGGDQIHQGEGSLADQQLDAFERIMAKSSVPFYGVIGNHEQVNPEKGCKYIERGLPVRFTLSYENMYMVGLNCSWLRGEFGDKLQQKEQDFIETQLKKVPADCEHRFIVMHWPLFVLHPGEEDTYWNMPNRKSILNLFKKYNISCILAGHRHHDFNTKWGGINTIASIGTSAPSDYPEELAFKIVTVFKGGWSARRVSVERC